MSAAISANLKIQQKNVETFIDKNFIPIAFAVSTLALLILSPFNFFVGTAIGLAASYFLSPPEKATGPVISLTNALFVIIGATGALLTLTPAGSGGGFIFRAIPFLASLAVGNTACRAVKSF